jgi:phage recombination protein Bet
MTAVAHTENQAGALALSNSQQSWTPQQRAALVQLGLDKAPDGDLAVFLHYAQRTGLDPFARQIYMIGRWDGQAKREKFTIQTSIDGFRIIAERHGKYGGQVGPEWCGEDGKWRDVWLAKTPPLAARVGVIRKDWAQPVYAVATFEEYAARNREGKLMGLWSTKPALMAAKCLPGRAKITTDQGVMQIGQIVKKRLKVQVRSIDLATGQEVWAPVVNWWRNGSTDQWVRIWAANGTRGNRCIRITTDHPIWTPHGWRKAGELSVGDQIGVTSPTLSADQDQVVLGGLLGDGHLAGRRTGNSLPHYAETHGVAQADYLRWKAAAFANLNPQLSHAQQTDGAGGTHAVLRMSTAAVPAMLKYRSMAPVERLETLSDLGVAVWLMDDGSIKSTGHGSPNPYIRIYCCGFGAEFAEAAAMFFRDRYGITAKVFRPEKNPYLRIGAKDTVTLMARMAPWLRYNAEVNNKEWVAGPVEQGSTAGMVFAPISRIETRVGGEPEGRYDIEVEGTHTFVYNNIVVSNCAESLALRKAFPHDLSGIYTSDEMQMEDNPPLRVVIDQDPPAPVVHERPANEVNWDAEINGCGNDRTKLLALYKAAPEGAVRDRIAELGKKLKAAAEPVIVDAEIVEDTPARTRPSKLDKARSANDVFDQLLACADFGQAETLATTAPRVDVTGFLTDEVREVLDIGANEFLKLPEFAQLVADYVNRRKVSVNMAISGEAA